jgi:hypothetical protein
MAVIIAGNGKGATAMTGNLCAQASDFQVFTSIMVWRRNPNSDRYFSHFYVGHRSNSPYQSEFGSRLAQRPQYWQVKTAVLSDSASQCLRTF